jgi:hypothetical protein
MTCQCRLLLCNSSEQSHVCKVQEHCIDCTYLLPVCNGWGRCILVVLCNAVDASQLLVL